MYAESLRHYMKPVVEYLDDPTVTEILINGPEEIWIERRGRLRKVDAQFTEDGIEAAARNVAQYVGRLLNDERPRLDARMPDGSRVHVVMPPIARQGCTISIRKFFPEKLTVDNLVGFGSLTPSMARLIEALVCIKVNMMMSGGTGSGKTTLLNCVAQYIPDEERILTIEESAELQLNQEHLVAFEARPPDKFGKGKVDMGDLLHSALRLRPDRIVVGEVRGGEAFHLMQAMNTGHAGSLATVHANSPTDTLRRLETLCLQGGVDIPMVAIRAQVASAINIVVSCGRLQDGTRKITHISEVLPLDERGDYRTQDLFVFTPTHKDSEGEVHGYFAPTGLIPTFINRLAPSGFEDIDESFFDPSTYGEPPPPIFTASTSFKTRWAPSLAHRERGEPDPPELQRAFSEKKKQSQSAEPKDVAARNSGASAVSKVSGAKKTEKKSPRVDVSKDDGGTDPEASLPGQSTKEPKQTKKAASPSTEPAGKVPPEDHKSEEKKTRPATSKKTQSGPGGDTDPRIVATPDDDVGFREDTDPLISMSPGPTGDTTPGFDPGKHNLPEPPALSKERSSAKSTDGKRPGEGTPEKPSPASKNTTVKQAGGKASKTVSGKPVSSSKAERSQPSIQLDEDFAAEASEHGSGDKAEKGKPKPGDGKDAGAKEGARRRRKGGIIGRR